MLSQGQKRKLVRQASRELTKFKRRRFNAAPSRRMRVRSRVRYTVQGSKFVDNNQNLAITTATSVFFVGGIAQGINENQRIGSVVRYTQFTLRYIWFRDQASANARLMIIHDKQPNGVLPALNTILENAATVTLALTSGVEMSNAKRWTTMYDSQAHRLDNATNAYHSDTVFRRCTRLVNTEFSGVTSGIADISTGAFYLIALYDSATANASNLNYQIRFRYVD